VVPAAGEPHQEEAGLPEADRAEGDLEDLPVADPADSRDQVADPEGPAGAGTLIGKAGPTPWRSATRAGIRETCTWVA